MGVCIQGDPFLSQLEMERSSEASADRRAHPRIGASDVTAIKAIRVKCGSPLALIDLSAGGAQVGSAAKLQPGSTLVVEIDGPECQVTVTSRVVRCEVATVTPMVTYRGALAFDGDIDVFGLTAPSELDVDAPAPGTTSCEPDSDAPALANTPCERDIDAPPSLAIPSEPELDARQELARFTLALKRLRTVALEDSEDEVVDIRQASIARLGRTAVGAAAMALAAASSSVEGARVANALACLLRDMSRGIENKDRSAAIIKRIGQGLWYWAGAHIGIDDVTEAPMDAQENTVHFDLPEAGNRPAARLLVEFEQPSKPTALQLHLLKAAARLVGLARALDGRQP